MLIVECVPRSIIIAVVLVVVVSLLLVSDILGPDWTHIVKVGS